MGWGGAKEKQNLKAGDSLKILLYTGLKHLFGETMCLNAYQKERRSNSLSSRMDARPCAKHYMC